MRAVTYVRNNTVEVLKKDLPDVGANEVRLKVSGAGLCASDLSIIAMGDENPLVGSTLGHEVSGVIDQMGDAVTGWQVGDAALVALVLNCGTCRECVSGRDNECRQVSSRDALAPLSPGIGTPGGMAEYIVVKAHQIVPLGELDPVDAAPLSDAALTPMHAINTVRDRLKADSTVVAIGLGGLGHLGLQILATTTGARIIAVDTDPQKVEYAANHGADLALTSDEKTAQRILDETGGWGADVVLDFVGVQPTVDLALGVIAQGGAIRFVGLGEGAFEYVAGNSSIPWGVNIERAYGGPQKDLREVVALAQQGKIAVEVTRYPLDDAPQAFKDLQAGKIQGRIVLVP